MLNKSKKIKLKLKNQMCYTAVCGQVNIRLCLPLCARISGIPKLGMLREGLKLFISHFLLRNTQTQEPAEQAKVLIDRAEVATKAMEAREAKLKL